MAITRDDVRREVNAYITWFRVAVPGEGFSHEVEVVDGDHDCVPNPGLITIGPCRDDDLRPALDRALNLVTEWVLDLALEEPASKHTTYQEDLGSLIFYLARRIEVLDKQVARLAAGEYCRWCDRNHQTGRTRGEVEANRAEQDAIAKELGLK